MSTTERGARQLLVRSHKSGELQAVSVKQNVWYLLEVVLRSFDQANGVFLQKVALIHLLTENFFKFVCLSVDTYVLWPKIADVVTTTHAKWDVVVNFEVLTGHAFDGVAKILIVILDDFSFKVGANVTVAVGDFFWVTVTVGICTKLTRSQFLCGTSRKAACKRVLEAE